MAKADACSFVYDIYKTIGEPVGKLVSEQHFFAGRVIRPPPLTRIEQQILAALVGGTVDDLDLTWDGQEGDSD